MADRIILIEDDRNLGEEIVATLRRHGFEVTWWLEGRVPDQGAFELLIVDLMLPGLHGLEILRSVREQSDAPVLVLSARNDTTTKVRALKLGADDYVTKPFWPEELVERVRARLRRPAMGRAEAITSGELRIGTVDRVVTFAGRVVDLTRAEYEILLTLARRPGAAVTRAALAEAALDVDRENADRTLDVHVSRVRKKLGDPTVIQTVWGVGYRLAGESAAADPMGRAAMRRPADPS